MKPAESSTDHVHKSVAKAAGILEVDGKINEVVFGPKAMLVQKLHDLSRFSKNSRLYPLCWLMVG